MKTLTEALNKGKQKLREKNITNADLDAWYLLEFICNISKLNYLLDPNKKIEETEYNRYLELIDLRANHTPLQYITSEQEFMGLKFIVNKDVLIPRQDTETLVEEVMKVAKNKSVLDMCTGSGCIIVSLAKLCDLNKAVGVDFSEDALYVARKNISAYNLNVELIHSDLFEEVEGKFDVIVSNPPYIPTSDIEELTPEVKANEPIMALDGFEDGLYFYKKIIAQVKDYLNDKGVLFFEIGYNQGNSVKELLEKADFHKIHIVKDLAGLDRVVYGYCKR